MDSIKRVLMFCLLAVVSFGLVANGQKESETADTADEGSTSGKTQITFMSPLDGADGAYMDEIIQGFNAANPDVEVVHFVNNAEFKQKLTTGIATETAPEVVLIRKFDVPQYMDHFVGFSDSDLASYGIDITDVYPNLRDGLVKDGKNYGIPLDVWIFYYAYNKANFKAAGLDPENPQMDLDGFISDMEAIKSVTPDGITPYYESSAWTWIFAQFLWQFGGDFLTDDYKKPAFMEAGAEACNMILDMQERGILPPGAVDAGPAFESGDASCLITGIWTIKSWGDILGDDFGYAVSPQFGNTNAVFGGSHIIEVTESMVKDPAKKEAAMRWIKYLWDHMIDWYAAGQTPSRKSIAEGSELKEKLPNIYKVAQQLPYVKSFQMFPYITEVVDELAVYLEACLYTKEMTPEQAMDEAAQAVQYILDDYWAAQ